MSFTEFPIPTTPAAAFVRGESEATPTADKIVRAPSASQYLDPGWQTPHAVLLPEYEDVPAGYYDTGERVGTNKVVVNWELAQLYDYGEIDGSAADPDGDSVWTGFDGAFVDPVAPGDSARYLGTATHTLALGDEIVTNGADGFSGTSGWTAAGVTLTEVGGELVIEATDGSADRAEYAFSGLEVGAVYRVEVEIEPNAAAVNGSTLSSWSWTSGAALTLDEEKEFSLTGFFVANSTSGVSRFYASVSSGSGAGKVITIRRFSVRKVLGLPWIQPNDTQQGLYVEAPADIRNLLSGTDALATQDVDVTAAEHTLSFKGTGSVTLSGASTAGPLNGTGAEDIVSLTFTPTAGTLTLTVSGTVENAQLELGESRTDYQSANADRTNITSATEPSFGQIRMDQVDDEYSITLANGLTNGTFIVGGRDGTWVEEGVSLAAGGTWTIGPADVTGATSSQILINHTGGDIVDWLVIDGPLSEIEITRAVEYMKARGAGDRVVV